MKSDLLGSTALGLAQSFIRAIRFGRFETAEYASTGRVVKVNRHPYLH